MAFPESCVVGKVVDRNYCVIGLVRIRVRVVDGPREITSMSSRMLARDIEKCTPQNYVLCMKKKRN